MYHLGSMSEMLGHLIFLQAMIFRLTLLLLVGVLAGCEMYPLGHSRNGDYFGGQGAALAPRERVPKAVQREQPLF
jgi:predicted lipid-binding transport protein (Tim44 family)